MRILRICRKVYLHVKETHQKSSHDYRVVHSTGNYVTRTLMFQQQFVLYINLCCRKTNCEICRKDFPSVAAYRRHELRWHNETGNVTCEVCGKKSRMLTSLLMRRMITTNECIQLSISNHWGAQLSHENPFNRQKIQM